MEKPSLDLIKKSDIIKGENVMKDFEYIFLDINQVWNRIQWFKEQLVYAGIHQRKVISVVTLNKLLTEAFDEIKRNDDLEKIKAKAKKSKKELDKRMDI